MMFLCICLLMFATATTKAEECPTTFIRNKSFLVYYGWPFTYHCLDILVNTDCIPEDLEDYGEYTCVIYEANTTNVVFNSSFSGVYSNEKNFAAKRISHRFDNITTKTPLNYVSRLQNASSYLIENFTLKPEHLIQEFCEENLNKSKTELFKAYTGSLFHQRCSVNENHGIPLELIENNTEAKIYWLHNCKSTLPANTYQKGTSLSFVNMTYKLNPGVYTCVVEYNNMKRYRIHRKICVKVPTTSETSLSCIDKGVEIGGDVEVECNVDAGIGKSCSACRMRIDKLNSSKGIDHSEFNLSCQVSARNGEKVATNPRGSCILSSENAVQDCFYGEPTKEELQKQHTKLKFVFKIKNVQKSDFGSYRAMFVRVNGRGSENIFNITHDNTSTLAKYNVILIVAVATTLGIILLVIILYVLFGVETRWICFKIFAPEEKNVKKYSAYLAYHYRQDMTETDPTKFIQFVTTLISQIRKQNDGKIYNDCQEHGDEQYAVENIVLTLKESHRAIIILTPEYIKDEWSVLEAAEAWKNAIEQGTKIIFITLSESHSAIRKLRNSPRNFLQTALKRHKVAFNKKILHAVGNAYAKATTQMRDRDAFDLS